MNKEELYKKALREWGNDSQINLAVEECAELIKVLMKHGRDLNGSTLDEILEELADVEIMVEQMKLIFDYKEHSALKMSVFEFIKKRKLERLEKRLNESNNEK